MNRILPVILATLWAGAAQAAENCTTASAAEAKRPPIQWQADGLAVAAPNGRLVLWPMRPGMKLNREIETEISFADRSSCVTRLPPGTERGASIPVGQKSIKAIDAAICHDDDGLCVPIHIELRP